MMWKWIRKVMRLAQDMRLLASQRFIIVRPPDKDQADAAETIGVAMRGGRPWFQLWS